MSVAVIEEPAAAVDDYAGIPIAFEVSEVLDVAREAGGDVRLDARRLPVPYVKDYDAIDGGPAGWAERFGLSNWGFFSAFSDGQRVGRATVARDTPALEMLEGRSDRALVWDIRVAPSARRRGVGAALFEAAARWASARGCRELAVETQNINAAACRFYAAQGCVLRGVDRDAYPDFPDEIRLIWFRALPRRTP